MAQVPDLYAVLGVPPDASQDDIKRAYRRLARELHPDVNSSPEAEQRFKEVAVAYETLSDPGKRRQYDAAGRGGFPPDFFPFGDAQFGDLGDLFDVFFGGSRRRPQRRSRTRRGEDVFVEVALSFEEAAFGVHRDVEADVAVRCERCAGSGCEPGTQTARCGRCGGAGQVQESARSLFGTIMTSRVCSACEGTGEVVSSPCHDCRGEGRKLERRTLTIEVPAGVADGTELRVPGSGHAGRGGGPPGDLYASVRVAPHEVFERRGQDLVAVLTVPMTQAALGAEVRVPTLDGEEAVRIEPGTPSGTVLRLKGKGVPNLGRRGRGDLFLSVEVETPRAGSKAERRLLEQLAEERGEPTGRGSSPGRLRRPGG